MEIKTVDSDKMKALQFLADTNMKIGEARTLLQKLQESETEYLVGRENKVLARISQILDDSAAVLAESAGNYEKVKELYDSVSAFADLLAKAFEDFSDFQAKCTEKIELEEARLNNVVETIANQRRILNVDRVKLDNDKANLEKGQRKLANDTRKLASDRATLDNAIKRLKEGRI